MSYIREKIIWPLRYRKAVKSADKRAHYIHANIYVILCGGRLLLMSKKDIVRLCYNGTFKARPDQIRKMAIYTAKPL